MCVRRPPNQCNSQVLLYCRQRGNGFCTSRVQWQFSYGLRYILIVSKQPILKFWIILIAQHNTHSPFATKILTKFSFFRGCFLKSNSIRSNYILQFTEARICLNSQAPNDWHKNLPYDQCFEWEFLSAIYTT